MMQVRVLGSAAGGGFPQWNCNCANCSLVRSGAPGVRARTQSSVAATANGRGWVLLNASPDLRQQILGTPPLQPTEGRRDSPIKAVVLTNADVDHVAGLLTLRERQPVAVYATSRVLAALSLNPIFAVLDPGVAPRRELPLARPIELAGAEGEPLGVSVEAFDVPGKVALYLEDAGAGPGWGTQPGDTVGLSVAESGRAGGFFYVPGCAAVDGVLAGRLAGAGLVLFDGTLFRDDEMTAGGTGTKSGQRMGHISIDGPRGSLAAFAGLGVRQRVFIHVNNTNPILVEHSPERAAVEAAGWQVAHDGQEFAL